MSSRKSKKRQHIDSSKLFELESVMKFQEMPLDSAIKILKDSGTVISDDEVAEILLFCHTLVKITIKEFLSTRD